MKVYSIQLVDFITIMLKRDDTGQPIQFHDGKALVFAPDFVSASRVITSQPIERVELLGEMDDNYAEDQVEFNPLTEVMSGASVLDRLQTLLDIDSDEHLFLTVAVLDSSMLPMQCCIEAYVLNENKASHVTMSDGRILHGVPGEIGYQLREVIAETHAAAKKQATYAESFGAGSHKIVEMLKKKFPTAKEAFKGCGRPNCKTCGPAMKNPPAMMLGLHTSTGDINLDDDQHETVVKGLHALFSHMNTELVGVSIIKRGEPV